MEKLLELVEPALRQALKEKPSPEVRRRVEGLLAKIENPDMGPDKVRTLRAIEVLQSIGTPEAKRVLQTIAQGLAEAQVTRESKASLDYLARQNAAKRDR